MTESIVVHLTYSAEDYARGSKFVTMRNSLLRFLWLLPLVAAALLLSYALILTKGNLELFRRGGLVAFIFALTVVSIVLFVSSRSKYSKLAKRQFQKQINTSPALSETRTITFDAEGIKGEQSLGSGETKWDAVIEAVETTDDFYFFTAKRFALFVPKSAFGSKDDQQRVRSLLQLVLSDKAKLLR